MGFLGAPPCARREPRAAGPASPERSPTFPYSLAQRAENTCLQSRDEPPQLLLPVVPSMTSTSALPITQFTLKCGDFPGWRAAAWLTPAEREAATAGVRVPAPAGPPATGRWETPPGCRAAGRRPHPAAHFHTGLWLLGGVHGTRQAPGLVISVNAHGKAERAGQRAESEGCDPAAAAEVLRPFPKRKHEAPCSGLWRISGRQRSLKSMAGLSLVTGTALDTGRHSPGSPRLPAQGEKGAFGVPALGSGV